MLTERQVLSHPAFSEFLMQTKAKADAKAQHDTQTLIPPFLHWYGILFFTC